MHADPFQFAYKRHRGADDAVLPLLHGIYNHLDFSRAFNTMQPQLMGQKLLQVDVNPHPILWILSFLTDRHQSHQVNSHLNSSKTVSTGAPQESVISSVLYALYTNNCRSTNPGITYVKYYDNTEIMDTTNSYEQLQTEMDIFAEWCWRNCLDLNTSKTKDLVVDFHKDPSIIVPTLSVNNQSIVGAESYRYLGTVIYHRLTFQPNSDTIFSKCQQRFSRGNSTDFRFTSQFWQLSTNVSLNLYRLLI